MLFNLVPPLVDLATQHIRVISAANDDRWLVYRKDAEKTTSWTPSLLALASIDQQLKQPA